MVRGQRGQPRWEVQSSPHKGGTKGDANPLGGPATGPAGGGGGRGHKYGGSRRRGRGGWGRGGAGEHWECGADLHVRGRGWRMVRQL